MLLMMTQELGYFWTCSVKTDLHTTKQYNNKIIMVNDGGYAILQYYIYCWFFNSNI